ncbi:MAG: PspC domain-containing protein [Propionibacteriales bacterium]|nr:PspC domain-containing protein [Propionibacteriales bacterium]
MDTNSEPFTPRHATRSADDRYLGGVAGGLAMHLGLPPMWVRAGFLVSTVLGGFGIVMYAALWMVLPLDARFTESEPGLAAATRQGRRPRRATKLEDVGPLVALSVAGIGVVILLQSVIGWGSALFWPLLIGTIGIAVLWRQADEAQRERWTDTSGRVNPLRAIVGGGGWASYTRLLVGGVLLVTAVAVFAVQSGRVGELGEILVAVVLGVLGLALIVGPWLFRLANDLTAERSARVRTQERADMAAHLHDSVLQTLALIQKHAADGRMVATLARAQERDLRSWLYGDPAKTAATVSGALRTAAAEVEDGHGVPVEVVTVGDAAMSEALTALVQASREAMVNAAKHSGADKVDVYAEMGEGDVLVFVRDRGKGFDQAQIPDDRLGLRGSIIDRMERHGGDAEIKTAPGEGTEVRLSMTHRTGQTNGQNRTAEESS